MYSGGGGVCLGERDSGGSEVGLGDVLGQQGVVVIRENIDEDVKVNSKNHE